MKQSTYLDIMACVARRSRSKPPAPLAEAGAVSPAGPDILPALVDNRECQAEFPERPAWTGSWMRVATVGCLCCWYQTVGTIIACVRVRWPKMSVRWWFAGGRVYGSNWGWEFGCKAFLRGRALGELKWRLAERLPWGFRAFWSKGAPRS